MMNTPYQYDPRNPTLSHAYDVRSALTLSRFKRESRAHERAREISLSVRTILFPLVLTRGILYRSDELARSLYWRILEKLSGERLPR